MERILVRPLRSGSSGVGGANRVVPNLPNASPLSPARIRGEGDYDMPAGACLTERLSRYTGFIRGRLAGQIKGSPTSTDSRLVAGLATVRLERCSMSAAEILPPDRRSYAS